MFGHFYFPDGTHIEYDDFNEFQKFFLEWLRQERTKSNLTFPVLTEASLDVQNENGEWEAEDKDWMDFCAEERSKGLSFFSYNSKSVDALASCCRLRNAIEEENDFSYSLGAGGVETGSHSVMTINLNRLFNMAIYDYLGKTPKERDDVRQWIFDNREEAENEILRRVEEIVHYLHKFQYSHRMIVKEYIDAGLYSAYSAGFIHLDKQFSTLGM